MKYLKLFLNDVDYQNYVKSDDYVKPNVSFVKDTDIMYYTPHTEAVISYKMVDLGLPSGLKWADRNIGATSPEDDGLFFRWGETLGITAQETEDAKYDGWTDYFDTTDGGSTFNKYNKNGGLTVLESSDDAATVNMGLSWRMPTHSEIRELINNTTFSAIDINGNEFSREQFFNYEIESGNFKGIKFTGSNGNSIFIPASGYRSISGPWPVYPSESKYNNGGLWSSSLTGENYGSNDNERASELTFVYEAIMGIYPTNRNVLIPVRGVCN